MFSYERIYPRTTLLCRDYRARRNQFHKINKLRHDGIKQK